MKSEKYLLRSIALELLVRIGEQGGFSHLAIDQMMKKHQLEKRDGALLTEIVYGTLQRKLTIEYFLASFVDKKKKMNNWVKWLLYLSIYQMHYLEKVPDHAIIHESVEIAKKKGHKGIANFVNGVLRTVQREGVPDFSEIKDEVHRLSISTSHPLWLVKRWVEQYGYPVTEAMCQANMTHKQMTIRVQPLKISRDELISNLEEDGFQLKKSQISDQGIIIEKGNVLKHQSFDQNLFTVQDESSMLVAELMDLTQDMVILDACSAPGGKTTHIAEKIHDNGQVYAYDLHEKKAKLVEKKAEQLGLSSIITDQSDARNLHEKHDSNTFDRILIDAPCSGLGVLKSKPDIRYNKKEDDIHHLAKIQKEILDKVSPLLKNGGKLIYSTCTVDKEENEKVISYFLGQHPEFQIDPDFFNQIPALLQNKQGVSECGMQIFPQDLNSDGFFITRMIKVEK
ncbi:16S rRNA (cytosine967-C5)-methyltransferase [Gracilibacillus ureilyticus]|uniref:16S rRNA (cytosine(967)-C(5))-methyltransferase n=1 Tax=Gracilibacillus ureilyticus TaxID=531814 RepID=A0A1H9L129_9BACI|nr:16S rRNA (cytosine(967)-C(5))-methyltransferase RsmB [Gracilibacillus ureilyticus]SER05162.1 16S rRNA (cytosine967-C5)-methyltransferase [Gracilibacillus ureilyticus]